MAISASQASEPAIQIDEAILDEVFITWKDYKNFSEKLWTYSEAAKILGVTVNAIKSQKNKKPNKYVWGEFFKYIQQPASSKNGEHQAMRR